MLELRATIADLQLRERPERAGRAATEGQHGSIRAHIYGVKRTGVRGTIIGVGVCVRVQSARRRPDGTRAREGQRSRKSASVKADSSRRGVDGVDDCSSWDSVTLCVVVVVRAIEKLCYVMYN